MFGNKTLLNNTAFSSMIKRTSNCYGTFSFHNFTKYNENKVILEASIQKLVFVKR